MIPSLVEPCQAGEWDLDLVIPDIAIQLKPARLDSRIDAVWGRLRSQA